MADNTDSAAFDEWVVVELLGHRRVAGRIRETQIAGAGFLRLDIPATDGHPEQTQYIAPGSVYALHPVTEDTARAVAGLWRPQPVQRWELPAEKPVDPWGVDGGRRPPIDMRADVEDQEESY